MKDPANETFPTLSADPSAHAPPGIVPVTKPRWRHRRGAWMTPVPGVASLRGGRHRLRASQILTPRGPQPRRIDVVPPATLKTKSNHRAALRARLSPPVAKL